MSNIGDVITERRARITALLTAALLITALTLFAATPGAASDEAVSPANAPEWAHAGKKLLSTNSPLGADTPSVAYRPDGAEVMVVYNHWRSTVENRDRTHSLYGTTWAHRSHRDDVRHQVKFREGCLRRLRQCPRRLGRA